MAKAPSYYNKFTITSIPDTTSGGFSIPDYERDMKALVNQAVKSALSEGGYFKTSGRIVNKSTGEMKLDVFVHPSDSKVVADSLLTEIERLKYKDNRGIATANDKYKLDIDTTTKKETKALAREEANIETEHTRFNKGALMKVVGLLTTIAGIARRILSSVLTFSSQTLRDNITAHNLGMGYEAVRAYRHTEAQHGLAEGTIVEAVSGEQQKYGNITSLDEKSLEYIALIMGSKVEDMAKMGIGASNPEAIVEAIVDRANELANTGYNSVGQYVGEQQARRELYSYLLKYSPQIADIFATMQEEQHNINSLFRGQAETFEQWKNIIPKSRGNHVPAEYNIPATLGQQWNIVKDIYNQIKEGIALSIAPELLVLLRRIANIRAGMSDRESKALDEKNRAENKQFIDNAKVQLSTLGNTEADKQRALALNFYIEELEKENEKKTKIASLVPTADEIVVKGQELMETAIRFRVATKQESYSPEMKYVVDTYLDAGKRSKVEGKYLAEAQKQRKNELATERLAEIEKSAEYQEELASEMQKYDGKFSGGARSQAEALLLARYMFGDKADFRYDENGKKRNLASQVSLALQAGYITSSGGITPYYSIDTDKIDLTGENFEEALYEALYSKYIGQLAGYLANELIYQSKEKAKEGTPAYDLDLLQRAYGSDLSGLTNKIGTGVNGSIISTAVTEANGLITHKIVFDLNNNGKVEASDVPLLSYTTNRISDVNKVTDVEIKNGKVNWIGTQASGM